MSPDAVSRYVSRINLTQRIVLPLRSTRGVKPENAKALRGVIRDNTHAVADNPTSASASGIKTELKAPRDCGPVLCFSYHRVR